MDDDFDGTDPVLAQYLAAHPLLSSTPNPNLNPPPTQIPRLSRRGSCPSSDRHLRQHRPAGRRVRADPPVRHARSIPRAAWPGRRLHEPPRTTTTTTARGYDGRGRARATSATSGTPGMPQEIRYPYGATSGPFIRATRIPQSPTAPYNGYFGQRYPDAAALPGRLLDRFQQLSCAERGIRHLTTTVTHGFQSMLTPEHRPRCQRRGMTTIAAVTSSQIAAMACHALRLGQLGLQRIGQRGRRARRLSERGGNSTSVLRVRSPAAPPHRRWIAPGSIISPRRSTRIRDGRSGNRHPEQPTNPLTYLRSATSYGPNLGAVGNPASSSQVRILIRLRGLWGEQSTLFQRGTRSLARCPGRQRLSRR